MRKILFRGKSKAGYKWITEGEWIEGSLLQSEGEKGTFCQIVTSYLPNEKNQPAMATAYEVNPETVCQCTGLTDKNGRKIFEGDILSAHLDDQHPEDITYVQITWDGFSWCMRESTEDDVMSEYDCNIFEVCGNIFDNPELIRANCSLTNEK